MEESLKCGARGYIGWDPYHFICPFFDGTGALEMIVMDMDSNPCELSPKQNMLVFFV